MIDVSSGTILNRSQESRAIGIRVGWGQQGESSAPQGQGDFRGRSGRRCQWREVPGRTSAGPVRAGREHPEEGWGIPGVGGGGGRT